MRGAMPLRRFLIITLEVLFMVLTYGLSCMLVSFQMRTPALFLQTVPIVVGIKLVAFYHFGLFRGWWRYVGMSDALDITLASVSSSLTLLAVLLPFWAPTGYLVAVLFIDLVLTVIVVGGSRFAVRAYTEAATRKVFGQKNTIIVGVTETGHELARELLHNPNLDYNPVGFVDDDPAKKGGKIHGVSVLGSTTDLPSLIKRYKVQCVIVAIQPANGNFVRSVLNICSAHKVEFKVAPSLTERINGSTFTMLRSVVIEDVLGRKPVRLELENIRSKLNNKVVVVTGAGGSIGSELVRQAARFSPKRLVLLDRSENDLFKLSNELQRHFPSLSFVPTIGDIADIRTLRDVFARHHPDSVFHAAAYKHVPMMENNCFQAVSNNIFGTYNLAMVSREHEVGDFIMISTDKAVNPTSVMGVTKRIAELIVMSLQNSATRFTAVRFGNVLGSNGSVLPVFQEQIASGGPVTVTHPKAYRYFMTIPEAAQLVLQASAMGHGGEIFVLEMGEPISILEVARSMIRMAGLVEDRDIQIVFTGLRPGEKLFEELKLDAEGLRPTPHEKIRVFETSCPQPAQVRAWLEDLSAIVAARNTNALILKFKEIVPTYLPSPELLALCSVDRYDQSWRYLKEAASYRSAIA